MCDVWKKRNTEELSTSDIRKIFSDKGLSDLRAIKITGGEPFIRKDLPEIVEIINEKTKAEFFHITTNGLLTNKILEMVEEILRKGINLDIKVSIDAIGAKHDKMRGIKGAYKKAHKTAIELKKLQKKYPFYLGINQVITKSNIDEMKKVHKLCKNMGVEYHGMLALKSRPLFGNKKNITEDHRFSTFDNFTKSEFKKIIGYIKKTRKKKKEEITGRGFLEKMSSQYYLNGAKNRLVKNKNYPKPPCMALFSHIRLNPNGDLITCSYITEPLGNLKNNTFTKIWSSNKAKNYRRAVKKCSGCWLGCEVTPNSFHSGDIIKWWILGN